MTASQITIDGVSKSYSAANAHKQVIEDCSLTVERGKVTVLIGPSGCGKSTLVRLLAGFEQPTSGRITLDGELVGGPSHDRLVLFQETALFPWMTVLDNVLYGPRARGRLTPDSHRRAAELLQRVGCEAFTDKYPSQLSGGMQRRVELARAMINDPKIMILDEPFRGLDALTKELMWQYYASLFECSGSTHLFITTDIEEAVYIADRIVVMANIPTRPRAVIDVDLPRPRDLVQHMASDRVAAIKRQALQILHEEALRSFASGNKAALDFIASYEQRFAQAAADATPDQQSLLR